MDRIGVVLALVIGFVIGYKWKAISQTLSSYTRSVLPYSQDSEEGVIEAEVVEVLVVARDAQNNR